MAARFCNYDMSEYVDMNDIGLRNTYEYEPGQGVEQTVGGYSSVTDRAFTNMPVAFLLQNLKHSEYRDLRDFFKDTIVWSYYLFWIRIPNNRDDADWNRRDIEWRCDATIGDSTITCDQQLDSADMTCDQAVPADYEFIGPLRLAPGGFRFTEYPDSIFQVSVKATVEHV